MNQDPIIIPIPIETQRDCITLDKGMYCKEESEQRTAHNMGIFLLFVVFFLGYIVGLMKLADWMNTRFRVSDAGVMVVGFLLPMLVGGLYLVFS